MREKIGVLEERLKDFGFVRPNSGALVHLRYLERIDLERLQILLELTGQLHTVPIARRKKKRNFTAVSSLLGGAGPIVEAVCIKFHKLEYGWHGQL